MLAGTHHVLFLSTLWMLPINKSILKAALSHLNFPSDLISLSYRSEFQLLTEGVSSLSVWAGSPGVGFCGAETHQLSHGHWAPSKWGEVWDKEGTSSLFHGKLNLFFFFFFLLFLLLIASQCCVGFWHTTRWISHKYTYIPSLLFLPPTPSYPSRWLQRTGLSSLCYTATSC